MNSEFISSRNPRQWESDQSGVECEGVFIGNGHNALEVVVARSESRPTKAKMRRVWSDRKGGRANPVLLVVLYGENAGVCGPSGEKPPVYRDLDPEQVKRVSDVALDKPNRHAAHRFLRDLLEQIEDELVGVRNQGLLSTHELKVGVPERDDWGKATEKSLNLLDKSERDLIESLGYRIESLPGPGYILKDENKEVAVAVFLKEEESFEHSQERFTDQSPVAYALNKAEETRVDFVIANSGRTLRLYTTNPEAGFGSRGRTDTFVEANLNLLTEETAGHLWSLFSAEALREGGSLHEIMRLSEDYAADLGKRLRERIYDDVIPRLVESIAEARDLSEPSKEQLDETYRMSLILLYRLLFIACAEDEGFLPRQNTRYYSRSLKNKAHTLHDLLQEGHSFDPNSTSHWDDVMRLVEAVHDGNREWRLPEYNGALLSSDPEVSPEGAELANIELVNEKFGPVLANLLIDETEDGYEGPVDFRNLGVREFGVVYEGLLESELSVADQPLGLDEDGRYVPVDDSQNAVVEDDDVYLHGLSGERKATGTYYTKTPFVEHLLDYSLEPALEEHIKRLDDLSDREAEKEFFNFKVADIAMGSGHFLVGAVDRIESKLYSYLTERSLPGVEEELDRLRDAAESTYESEEEMVEVERSQLLRRQIARRCIYGVDLNPLATELARLSIWVHTFVPGLPLTFLNHNLVTGDSLSGIGSQNEAADLLDMEREGLWKFDSGTGNKREKIRRQINKLGKSADADASEVREVRETQDKLERELKGLKALFEILAASRIEEDIDKSKIINKNIDEISDLEEFSKAEEVLSPVNPLHFPIAFPEVFQGDNPGFDVIVGNPPWEEEMLDKDNFWKRYNPGLKGKTQTEKEKLIEELEEENPDLLKAYEEELGEKKKRREILINGPYPGIGKGDPDTYKAFCWRFWNLLKDRGYTGVVLPRSAFMTAGSEDFRRKLLNNANITDLTFLKNKRGWVFDQAEYRYTIALIGFAKKEPTKKSILPLKGPYPGPESYQKGKEKDPYQFSLEKAKNWTGTASFPLLPDNPKSVEVFNRMSEHPRLNLNKEGKWQARPNTELHATNEKKKDDGTVLMHFTEDPPADYWPVYKGNSFNLWLPDTGVRYAWADPGMMMDYLQQKRENSYNYAGKRSAFYGMAEEWINDKSTLPCRHPRVVFRNVTNRTNRRTIISALIPPKIFVTNAAPYFVWPRGGKKDQAYLLAVLSSIPLDWYARRFVETNVNYHILNALPIPRPDRDSELWQRVVKLSARLASPDERFSEWANEIGVNYGPLEDSEKKEKIYELDALVACLYGLSREHVKVVFKTFHRGWDYKPRLKRVLEYYDKWEDR